MTYNAAAAAVQHLAVYDVMLLLLHLLAVIHLQLLQWLLLFLSAATTDAVAAVAAVAVGYSTAAAVVSTEQTIYLAKTAKSYSTPLIQLVSWNLDAAQLQIITWLAYLKATQIFRIWLVEMAISTNQGPEIWVNRSERDPDIQILNLPLSVMDCGGVVRYN